MSTGMLMRKLAFPPSDHGFTLIELIMVIVLIGIISITILPQWTGTSLRLEFEAARILNDIRYTQMLSVISGKRYRWVKLSSSSYQIVDETGTAIILPSGGSQQTLASNVSLGSLTNLPNNLVAFDSLGAPYTNTAIPGTALASTASIALSSGSSTRSINITPQTGYGSLQ